MLNGKWAHMIQRNFCGMFTRDMQDDVSERNIKTENDEMMKDLKKKESLEPWM